MKNIKIEKLTNRIIITSKDGFTSEIRFDDNGNQQKTFLDRKNNINHRVKIYND